MIPEGFEVDIKIIEAFSASWLMSSLLAVSTVTVAFCSNIIMAQDKISMALNDFLVTPVKRSTIAMGYFISNVISTLIICYTTLIIGLIYIASTGWFYSIGDILLIIIDVFLGVLLGASLASVVEFFISTEGGITAVGSLVSSLYGFLCGAYIPLSQFSPSIRNFISMLPSTYATGMIRQNFIGSVLANLDGSLLNEIIEGLKDGFDANLYFFNNKVEPWMMIVITSGSILVLLCIYIILNINKNKQKN